MPTSPLTIRDTLVSDIPAIAVIYADAVNNGTASYELSPPDADEMNRRFKTLQDGGFPYLVATLDNRIVGYAYAGPYRTRPAYRFLVEDSVYIDPAFQRRGIGNALLVRLIQACEQRTYRQIIAVIGDGSNHRASIRVHEKHGFRHIGLMQATGFKHGRWLDTALMQLSINGGASTLPDDA
ncbi:MAG: GNAT family N-acetyltransferase [Alphaproteobacteria bacterium]